MAMPAFADIDALDYDALVALAAVALQSLKLRRECAAEFVQAAVV